MADQIIHIKSLSQMHEGIGYEPPKHPLVSILDAAKVQVPEELIGQKITSDFYCIMLKDKDCGLQYGRNYYDFEEGVLSFTAPNQIVSSSTPATDAKGWMLFFHPDLIRASNLGRQIDHYTFFDYDVHEALHLSKKEEDILHDCIAKIEFELEQNIDTHSQNLLVSNIELMLNYCKRFYERQFNTRSNSHGDVITRIEHLIKSYYDEGQQLENGTPSIQYFADKVNLSANYLSDLLKKETGKNTKEHINDYILKQAKNKLLQSAESISEIAYDLGFNYPHYFSRMFKQKTGITPQQYRDLNLN